MIMTATPCIISVPEPTSSATGNIPNTVVGADMSIADNGGDLNWSLDKITLHA